MRRSQIRTVPETKPMVVTQYPTSNEPVLYVAPDFQQQGLDRLLGMSDTISGLDRAFNAPDDGDYMRRGDAWTGPQGSINAPEDGDYMRRGAAWVGPQGSINAPTDGNYMRNGAAWIGPQSSIDAPNDRLLYARRHNTWEPAIYAGSFFWSTEFALLGNEGISPVLPSMTWLIPPESLPAVEFYWIASGTGLGAAFFTNHGLPLFTYPAGVMPTLNISIEYPSGSGTWNEIAGLTPATQFADADRLVRLTAVGFSNRMWHYHPATDRGIHVGLRITTNGNSGNPYRLIFGIEGQILPLGLNVTRSTP
jgi:hypothetical protein